VSSGHVGDISPLVYTFQKKAVLRRSTMSRAVVIGWKRTRLSARNVYRRRNCGPSARRARSMRNTTSGTNMNDRIAGWMLIWNCMNTSGVATASPTGKALSFPESSLRSNPTVRMKIMVIPKERVYPATSSGTPKKESAERIPCWSG
jgi:hypothetical protein